MNDLAKRVRFPEALRDNLHELGYTTPTPIQQVSLPIIFSGKDLIAQAKTGSGKTAAFGIALVTKVDISKYDPQALVVCPTRELAEQVAEVLRRLGRWKSNLKILTLCGGIPMRPQMHSLEHGAHIVVGTPGRIRDHLGKKSLSLKKIETVILDEADRMLEMGFYEEIEKILSQAAQKRQTLLFSATFPREIERLAAGFMNTPEYIRAATEEEREKRVEEIFYGIENDRSDILLKVLSFYRPESAILFANTKAEVTALAEFLQEQGFAALQLHGDLDQTDRTRTLLQFANRSTRVLVATDVAARGLDIERVAMVINIGLPRKYEDYIHRVGRTARAGSSGRAVTLYKLHEAEKLLEFTSAKPDSLEKLAAVTTVGLDAKMRTVAIYGGRKDKLRPGDILGVLCKEIGLPKEGVGKIDIFDRYAYVAVKHELFSKALRGLEKGKIKNRRFKVQPL